MQTIYYSTPTGIEILKEKINKLKIEHKSALEDLKNSQSNNTDISENNEYLEANDRLDKIEQEKARIEDKYSKTRVIEITENTQTEKVAFGLVVKFLDVDEEKDYTYQIVGDEEADIKKGKISYASPLAKSIIGSKADDEVYFNLPNGNDRYIIILEIKAP